MKCQQNLDTNSPEDFLGADRGTKNHLAVSTGHRAHHQGSSNRRNKKRKHQRHIPFGPPGRPTVTASPRNESLYVTWSITDNGGRPTDKYQVQWKTSEQEYSTSRQHTVDNRETTISSLSNGTQYVVRVRASNDGGTVYGDWSSAALGNPQTPAGAGQLHRPVAQPRGNPDVDFNKTQNTITLTWFVIKGATAYQVDYRKQDETGDWTRVTGYFDRLPSAARGHRPYTVATGLDCNANYDFRVRARNQSDPLLQSLNGWTPYAYTQGRTGPCAQNGQITNVLVTLTPQCADLSWTAPAGGHTDGYKIQRYIYDSSDTQETIRNNTGNVANYSDCSKNIWTSRTEDGSSTTSPSRTQTPSTTPPS